MTTTVNLTGRTKRRVANIRRLIAALATREMLRDEIFEFLHITPSGGRKYLRDLRPVLEVARTVDAGPGRPGHPVYRLVAQHAVKQFLDLLEDNAVPYRLTAKRELLPTGRRFHIMQDDVGFAVKVHKLPVARDVLVAALFGPGEVRQ